MQRTLEGLRIDLSLLTTQLEDMTRLKQDAVQEVSY